MKKKTGKFIFGVAFALVFFVVAGVGMYGVQEARKEKQSVEKYEEAFRLYKEGKYDEAEKILVTMKNFHGVEEMLTDLYYQKGLLAFDAGDYDAARELFLKNPDYQDTQDYIKETAYQLGIAALANEDYETAHSYLDEISNYKDVADYLNKLSFADMKSYFANGDLAAAKDCILKISNYPGIEPYGLAVLPEQARQAFEGQDYEQAMKMYEQALSYRGWAEAYVALSPEEQAGFASIAGEVPFAERVEQLEAGYAAAKSEYQSIQCLKNLIAYYEEKMKETAIISEVDEVRFGMQTYSSDNIVPIIMISYKETFKEGEKEKQRQAYAIYNDTEFYAICHSLKMDEIDKSNSVEVQANLKLSKYWDAKDAAVIDMARIRSAMGWQ